MFQVPQIVERGMGIGGERRAHVQMPIGGRGVAFKELRKAEFG